MSQLAYQSVQPGRFLVLQGNKSLGQVFKTFRSGRNCWIVDFRSDSNEFTEYDTKEDAGEALAKSWQQLELRLKCLKLS